ncbi:MAG: class I SAM-dependent methyltransferase [Desulfohalobiaceae bacterium]|nr:class I SAM-dependent methyltransferase [Desulfohalobiaceae bacterium]
MGLQRSFRESGKASEEAYFPDWTRIDTTSPAGRRSGQPLLRAVQGRRGGKGLMIWDCTAGWGEDTWILAALGHRVAAMERNLLVNCCLLDAWSRAGQLYPAAARRIRPLLSDSRAMLGRLAQDPQSPDLPPQPDVVYLDPFFPQLKGRKSRERKPMRILRLAAESGKEDAEGLLRPALMVSRLRVVLKRPRRAHPLRPEGRGPVHTITGRGYRYDIYIPYNPHSRADPGTTKHENGRSLSGESASLGSI